MVTTSRRDLILSMAAANAILRDAERQGAYDRLLKLERRRRRWNRMRTIFSGTAAVISVTLIVAYELFGPIPPSANVAVKKGNDTAMTVEAVEKANDTP